MNTVTIKADTRKVQSIGSIPYGNMTQLSDGIVGIKLHDMATGGMRVWYPNLHRDSICKPSDDALAFDLGPFEIKVQ